MTADDELVISTLAGLVGRELDDTELDRRVTSFQGALHRLRDDPAEAARIDVLAMEAERSQIASFETFFEYYWPRLVRYLKARASNTGMAEDVAADAMTAALDRWDDVLTYQRPDTWLFKAATRMLRQLEARAREHGYLDEDVASSEVDLRIAAAADTWIEDHLDLIAGMRSLPSRQCEVIGLHYLGGYTLAETANILDIQVSTVRNHLNRGLENLRQRPGLPDDLRAIRRASA